MDLSFDIHNDKGDLIRVALSYYDAATLHAVVQDPLILSLVFFDVTLVRVSGSDYVGYGVLKAVSEVLHRFMNENENAVLCFYCDDLSDVERRHGDMSPQEYRSRLFSRMFDIYVKTHRISHLVNYQIIIDDDALQRYVHFITPDRYLSAVKKLSHILMSK